MVRGHPCAAVVASMSLVDSFVADMEAAEKSVAGTTLAEVSVV